MKKKSVWMLALLLALLALVGCQKELREPTNLSFPGLGGEPFSVDKIAFSIGPVEVRWYGIAVTLGIVAAFLYAAWRGKKNEGVTFDDVIDIGLFTVILGVIGARAYYVLTTIGEKDAYGNLIYDYDSFIDVIAVWNGGLAIYGGIVGGCIGIVIACLIKKIPWQRAFDMIGPGVMLAQAIGRWGNFFNGEAYGYRINEVTQYYFFNSEHFLPSGEGSFFHTVRMGVSHHSVPVYAYYHPTFLYECVWNILGFVLINLFYKRKKYDGQIALMYFTWYGFGRMFIEGFRTDSLYIPGTTLRISQCLGLACFLVGAILLIVFAIRPPVKWRLMGAGEVAKPIEVKERGEEPKLKDALDGLSDEETNGDPLEGVEIDSTEEDPLNGIPDEEEKK